MCFGAAFIAANSSSLFRVRKVFLTQHPEQSFSIHITPIDQSKLSASAVKDSADEILEDSQEPEDGLVGEQT
jgi:hypothetical protein